MADPTDLDTLDTLLRALVPDATVVVATVTPDPPAARRAVRHVVRVHAAGGHWLVWLFGPSQADAWHAAELRLDADSGMMVLARQAQGAGHVELLMTLRTWAVRR